MTIKMEVFMIFLKKLYSTKLKITLISLFCLICLLITGSVFWFISSQNDILLLKILRLNNDALPIFKIEAQLTYNDTLVSHILSGAHEDVLNNKALNILLPISDHHLDSEAFAEDMTKLKDYPSPILVSVTPSDEMAEQDYINSCITISKSLQAKGLTNVELIWYPQDLKQLKKYTAEDILHIGITIRSPEDLDLLDGIYKKFYTTKTLYVNEAIQNNYGEDSKSGVQAVSSIYYTLAIKYPGIQSIFSPYLLDPSVLPGDPLAYDKIYTQILSKPWITKENEAVSSISPYQMLNTYDILSGKEELVLSPDSKLLMQDQDSDSTTHYVRYKLNTTQLVTQDYYPYVINMDTTIYPNGINRLKAVAYGQNQNALATHSIDLTVQNEISTVNTPSLESHYPLGQVPIYTGEYIPILMYHTISDVVAPENQNSWVQTDRFEAQIKALVDNGYTTITFDDLWQYMNGTAGLPEKPIIITMDDGYISNYSLAYPIFKKYNASATLFVSPYYMSEENTDRHFGFAAAKEMEQSGLITIQPHGYDHTPFTRLSLKDLRYHISIAKGILEQKLGPRSIIVVSCPEFRNNYFTRKTLASQGVTLQITNLAKQGTSKQGTVLQSSSLKRINVPNTMTPEDLITTISDLTN